MLERLRSSFRPPLPAAHFPERMQTYLVISAVGKDRIGLVESISQGVLECGCHIGESRMTVLGGEFAVVMLVNGYWNAVAKLESALPRMADALGLRVSSTRTEARADTRSLIPYAVEVVAPEHAEVVHEVSDFFARRGINIEDVYTNRYPAPIPVPPCSPSISPSASPPTFRLPRSEGSSWTSAMS